MHDLGPGDRIRDGLSSRPESGAVRSEPDSALAGGVPVPAARPTEWECDACGEIKPDCESVYAHGVETLMCTECREADAPTNDAGFDFDVRWYRGLED